MKHPLRLLRLTSLPLLLGPTVTTAISPPRAWIAHPSSNAQGLFDENAVSAWNTPDTGARIQVLLEDWTTAEAALVASPANASFALAGSTNYRDWYLLTTDTDKTDGYGVRTFDAMDVRYIRLEVAPGSSGAWSSLFVGSADDVTAAAKAVGNFSWGDITQPENILSMADTAYTFESSAPSNLGVDVDESGIGWRQGTYYAGVSALWQLTGDTKYRDEVVSIGNQTNWTLRTRGDSGGKAGYFHADDQCIAQAWLELALLHPNAQPQWSASIQSRLDRIMADPLRGRVDYSWCDALFMAPPVYARLAALTGDDSYLEFMNTQWWDASGYLYDADAHLFYRDDRFFDDREVNGAKVFWGRGNGWVVAGLARILQYLPDDSPYRPAFAQQFSDMAYALKEAQYPADGLWGASLLYPEGYGTETSGSAFFVFALAWGVNEGLLPEAAFAPVIQAGWAGLAQRLDEDGMLHYIQKTGGEPVPIVEVDNRRLEYGYGAFYMAAVEMYRYYLGAAPDAAANVAAASFASERSTTAWQSVDSFDDLDAWQISVVRSDGAIATSTDPFDSGDGSTLHATSGTRAEGRVRAERPIPAIAAGTTATVYQRIAVDDPILDLTFGVAASSPISSAASYAAMLRFQMDSNHLEALDGSTVVEASDDFLQLETWYEVWLVIDQTAGTYSVYLKGGSNYPQQTLVAQDLDLGQDAGNALTAFGLILDPSSGSRGGLCLDDLQIDLGGVNLTTPSGVQAPRYSPWSAVPHIRNEDAVKYTSWGRIWDRDYPWIYQRSWQGWWYLPDDAASPEAGGWAWATPENEWQYLLPATEGDLFAWSDPAQEWRYLSDQVVGFYYDYGREKWVKLTR
ncbi:MAG: glucosyl hydrolase family protein [Puniceicoccaceae bacterium 5H]|nr:MAG: glucosyl hydrolase family protein [Puniceicoccaceae bacterium 5H]